MKPNILFIIIDSLRADKCYETAKTSKTPNIDDLIRNRTYFVLYPKQCNGLMLKEKINKKISFLAR